MAVKTQTRRLFSHWGYLLNEIVAAVVIHVREGGVRFVRVGASENGSREKIGVAKRRDKCWCMYRYTQSVHRQSYILSVCAILVVPFFCGFSPLIFCFLDFISVSTFFVVARGLGMVPFNC